MKARLKDVAERAGVAKNTASMILNRSPHSWASKETVKRVFRIAKEMDYQPDRAAVAFRKGKTNVIGLVIPDLQNPFYVDLAEILQGLMAKKGYDLIIESSRSDPRRESHCLATFVERPVDGIIFTPVDVLHAISLLEKYARRDKAVVALVESTAPALPVDTVAVNFTKGMTEVMDHLVSLGHQRIAFLIAVAAGQDEGKRPVVFRELMKQAGLSAADAFMAKSDHTLAGAVRAARSLLKKSSNRRPSAFIAHNDLAALGVLRAATELGLRVPQDLSVVGVDDTLIGRYLPVTLTTVRQPTKKMVTIAADLLMKRLAHRDGTPPQRRELETSLIVRESTARLTASSSK